MKNLDSNELQEVAGGGIIACSLAAIAIASAVIYVYNNVDDLITGYNDAGNGEYNPPKSCY